MRDSIDEVDVSKYCRICFEEKPGLVSYEKLLIIEDFTCTVEEILQLLSGQDVQVYPTYPSKICSTCKELAEATFALKVMYEKTSDILRNLLEPIEDKLINPKSEAIENNHSIEVFDSDDEIDTTEIKFEVDEDFEEHNHDLVDENNYEIEEYKGESITNKNSPVEEEIILEFEKPYSELSRDEKRRINRRKRRMMEKQEELELTEKIDNEIEATLNQSNIKLKKSSNFTHTCPICLVEKRDPLKYRKHLRTHKVLRKRYLKGKPMPPKSKFVAQPRDIVSIVTKPDALHLCPYCNESLPPIQFGLHLWNHEKKDQFMCEKCDRVFFKLRDFNLHKVRSHREEYPFKCNQCNQGFVIKYNFDCHMMKHNLDEEDFPHPCPQCPRKFSNSVHLWRHMFIHDGKGAYGSQYKKYKCLSCKTYFRTMTVYDRHLPTCGITTKQESMGKPFKKGFSEFPCRLCEKVFRSYSGLYQHMRNVHQKLKITRKKVCETCGKAVYNIGAHMSLHGVKAKPPPRICDICGKSFTTVANYFRHRRSLHSDRDPYLCDVCGKSFVHYDSFKVHERIHIGNKCHACPVCGKGFLEKSYMKKHLMTHDKAAKKNNFLIIRRSK